MDAESVGRGVRNDGKQKAALALHARIGSGHERKIHERQAEEFDARVFEIDHLLVFVADDPCGLNLPERRFLGVVLTGFAGGVDAVLQDGVGALGAIRPRRGEARVVDGLEPERIDEAVAIVVAEIERLRIGDLAVRLGQSDVALGAQALGLLVVGDLVRLDGRSAVIDLDVADGGDRIVRIVVPHFGGLHEHRRIRRRRRLFRRFGMLREMQQIADALRRGALRRQAQAGRKHEQRRDDKRARPNPTA